MIAQMLGISLVAGLAVLIMHCLEQLAYGISRNHAQYTREITIAGRIAQLCALLLMMVLLCAIGYYGEKK